MLSKKDSIKLILGCLLVLCLSILSVYLRYGSNSFKKTEDIKIVTESESKIETVNQNSIKTDKDSMVVDKNSRTFRDSLNISDSEALKLSRKIFKLGITDYITLEDITFSDMGDIYFKAIDSSNTYDFHLKMNSLEIITISDGNTYIYDSL